MSAIKNPNIFVVQIFQNTHLQLVMPVLKDMKALTYGFLEQPMTFKQVHLPLAHIAKIIIRFAVCCFCALVKDNDVFFL